MDMRYTLNKRVGDAKLARADLSYARVLVVDDIVTNLDVIKGMLKPYKLGIDCAISGRQAIEMIRAEKLRYDAVFMDHMMPGMDGIEATRIIREEIGTDYARNIPVIALTANAIVGNEELFLNSGFQDFISKPIDIAKLDAVLRRFVRNKELEKLQLTACEKAAEAGENERESIRTGKICIDGVGIERALERFGGDKTVLIGVLRSYAMNTRPLLRDLRNFMEREKLDDYATVVHGIKGSSYGIFAQGVGEAAEALEKAAKAGDTKAVKAGHAAFEKQTETLLGGIDRALCEVDALSDKSLRAEPDSGLLADLREAAKAFDMDGVDRIMELLESYRYERGGEIVGWLRKCVDGMMFEEIYRGEWPY
jgi:CheY-like chemotaxis protein